MVLYYPGNFVLIPENGSHQGCDEQNPIPRVFGFLDGFLHPKNVHIFFNNSHKYSSQDTIGAEARLSLITFNIISLYKYF